MAQATYTKKESKKKYLTSKKAVCIIFAISFIGWISTACYVRYVGLPHAIFDTAGAVRVNYGTAAQIRHITDKSGDSIELLTVTKQNSNGIILYFAGRSGRTPDIITDASKSQSVISPAYPGYYSSTGDPSPESIYQTVDVTMQYLLKSGYNQDQITVLGHSLGSLAALHAAAEYPQLKKVILINPLYTPKAVCSQYYGVFCALASNYASPASIAPEARAPIDQYHTADDEYISESQSRALFTRIGSTSKDFNIVPGTHASFNTTAILKDAE